MNVIGGSLKGKKLIAAKWKWLRPTRQIVKKSLFDTLGIINGLKFLDLYAGTGSIGIEAASRGAVVTMVDCRREAVKIIAENRDICNLSDCVKIEHETAEQFLAAGREKYDIVFIDPPYDIPAEKIDSIIKDTRQNMTDIENGIVVLEYRKIFKTNFAKNLKVRLHGMTVLNYFSFS
ncbi:MAG: methyltransferase [Epsilonproteobacteria bacterium]|nr:methyltransferase [Campylobacterota bacterium]